RAVSGIGSMPCASIVKSPSRLGMAPASGIAVPGMDSAVMPSLSLGPSETALPADHDSPAVPRVNGGRRKERGDTEKCGGEQSRQVGSAVRVRPYEYGLT